VPLVPFSPDTALLEKQTAHFSLRIDPGSYGTRLVEALAEGAEAAYERGCDWFGVEARPRVSVAVGDWLDPEQARASIDPERNAISLLVAPESPGLGLERAVLELLARPVSTGRVQAALLTALGGLVRSERGDDPTVADSDGIAFERHVRNKQPPRLFYPADRPTADLPDPALISFLAWLERKYGRLTFSRFARAALSNGPPAAALSTYSRSLDELTQEWLQVLARQGQKTPRLAEVLRQSGTLLRPHWLRVSELGAYMAVDLAFTFAITLFIKSLFDDIIAPRQFSRLIPWMLSVVLVFAIGSLATYRRIVVAGLIGELVLRQLRRLAFAQLQRLSVSFYDRSRTGDILSRITSDMDTVQGVLGQSLPQLIFELLSLAVAVTLLLVLNWRLGLGVLVVGVPAYAFVYRRSSESLQQSSRYLSERTGAMTAFLQENLAGQTVVKSFSLERRAIDSFDQLLGELFGGSLRMIRISAVLGGLTGMIYIGIQVAVLGAGTMLIMRGEMTTGALVAFIGVIARVLSPVVSISAQYQQVQSATGAFERVGEIMDAVPDVSEDPVATDLPDLQKEIRLEHVSYRHGLRESALQDVSFTIPVGMRVAVVGPSGAGKSTMVALLLRLRETTTGRILFDGRDIRGVTLRSLRRQIAVVPQDTFLFNSTIRENIAMGREGATDADMIAAAEAAGLAEVVSRTPAGYETMIGERGVRFSGGERQRLAIARALIRDPRILILDEATSALDPQTEAAILRTIVQASRGRTTLMVTHRLSVAAAADRIFVLDRGRLVEQGSHAQLIDARGLYSRMYEQQMGTGVPAGARQLPPALDQLGRIPLLGLVSREMLQSLAEQLTAERFVPGEDVVCEGEPGEKLYLIGRGQLEVLVNDGYSDRRVNTLNVGDYFGEMALLDNCPRTATVRATEPTELYTLTRASFLTLLEGAPTVRQMVMKKVAQRRAELTAARAKTPT
jgi:ATP-binding cassette subfamily B protein